MYICCPQLKRVAHPPPLTNDSYSWQTLVTFASHPSLAATRRGCSRSKGPASSSGPAGLVITGSHKELIAYPEADEKKKVVECIPRYIHAGCYAVITAPTLRAEHPWHRPSTAFSKVGRPTERSLAIHLGHTFSPLFLRGTLCKRSRA